MNDLQAKLIKQEQAAVLQVVNHDQTQLCTFLSLFWGSIMPVKTTMKLMSVWPIKLAAYSWDFTLYSKEYTTYTRTCNLGYMKLPKTDAISSKY